MSACHEQTVLTCIDEISSSPTPWCSRQAMYSASLTSFRAGNAIVRAMRSIALNILGVSATSGSPCPSEPSMICEEGARWAKCPCTSIFSPELKQKAVPCVTRTFVHMGKVLDGSPLAPQSSDSEPQLVPLRLAIRAISNQREF